ncbi:MAG: hypothetical protein Fur0010_23270 [Bdellovibrio sp.]
MKKLSAFLESSGYRTEHKNYSGPQTSRAASLSFDFIDLIARWSEIVGNHMADHSIPLKLTNKNLTLLTDHPTYSQSLKLLEQMLIEKIEKIFPELFGKIQKIQFQVNSQFFKETKAAHVSHIPLRKEAAPETQLHPQSPEYKKLKKEAEAALLEIQDPEIKNSLISIFIQNKTGKKH